MRFGFTDEQLSFRTTVRDLLREVCPPDVVRAAWGDAAAADTVWDALGAMGVLGGRAPEDAGGLGLSDIDLVGVFEEIGRVAVPGPLVEHAAVGVPLLAEIGAASLLGGAITGEITITVTNLESDLVPFGRAADYVILLTDSAAGNDTADVVRAVAPDECGARSETAVDGSRHLARVDLTTEDGAVLATGPTATAAMAAAHDRGALHTAAQLVGISQHLLDVTVEYAKERRQFGAPIGSYQAVKHHLANAALQIEFARPAVYAGAWSLATESATRSRDASLAKARASDAARFAARVALQCHGAIAYTNEHDLQLWMKRAWALAAAWGDSAFHRRRIADAVLGSISTGSGSA